nr:hypothetical protein [Tanacetum cinerariifolium]
MSSRHARGPSTASSSSLMQDVPGAFPPPPIVSQDDEDDEQQEVTFQSLSRAVYARRNEYVRPKHVRIK